LRFTALTKAFLQSLLSTEWLWRLAADFSEVSAEELEERLQPFLQQTIHEVVKPIWTEIRKPGALGNEAFQVENEQIPNFVRRQLGLNAYGAASWDFQALPLVKIGKTMSRIKTLTDMDGQTQTQVAAEIRQSLLGLLPPKLLEYTADHKFRTRAVCHDGCERIRGWTYGNIMSESNKFVWGCLGEPTIESFKVLAARPDSMDLEGGFLLCTIGKLVTSVGALAFRQHAAAVAQWMSRQLNFSDWF
jgi:hypothetical protein